MDIILYNIGFALLLLIIGYFCGSIPNGIWIGKLFFHKDPRDYGSKNSGGTNVGRVFGKKFGAIVIVLDVLKVMLPLYTAWAILTRVVMYNNLPLVPRIEVIAQGLDISGYAIQWPIYYLVAIGATIGHCLPIFAQFKGGKNVAVFYGIAIGTSWLIGIVPMLIFILILKIKKIVSIASIASSWISVLLSWTWTILILVGVLKGQYIWLAGYGPTVEFGYVHSITLTFAAIILTIRHKENIKRLIKGEEHTIKWMK